MAEAILSRAGNDQFRAYSAGSHPKGAVHPEALRLLRGRHFDVSGLRSKSWDEFAGVDAVAFDFIFTVCDNAAGEVCPVWLGHPMTAHWGIPDPAEIEGSPVEVARAFEDAYRMLDHRIGVFAALPIRRLDRLSLQARLRDIGQMEGATTKAPEPI